MSNPDLVAVHRADLQRIADMVDQFDRCPAGDLAKLWDELSEFVQETARKAPAVLLPRVLEAAQ